MHLEALTKTAGKLFPKFSKFSGFFLVGGTALALQLGHRLSVDFDFFSQEAIPATLLAKVKRVFVGSRFGLQVNNRENLTLSIDGVKTTFFHYPFPKLHPTKTMKGVHLFSLREIAAMKAYAIGHRGAYKDYVDLYFLLKEGHADLPTIIADGKKKYDGEFNGRLLLEQLTYLEDIPTAEIFFLRNPVSREELTPFFSKQIKKLSL